MATEKPPSSNPRGHYTIYSPEQKAEIGRYAAEHGNLKAVCAKFSAEYGIEVKESTARQFKKAYFMELSEGKNPEQITALRGKKRGRPSKVGGLNSPVSSIQKSVSAAVAAAGMMTAGNGESQQPVQYEQMVGEMAISTCITDLMNGDPRPKPVVLVAFCTDGKLENQELSSIAEVQAYPEVSDLSLVPEDVCKRVTCAIMGINCPIDRPFLTRCPKLKVIVTMGASCETIDLECASELGIAVCNIPDLCIEEIADSAFALILSLYRQTAFLHGAVQSGKHIAKQEDVFTGARNARRIRGKTLGLLGLGKTGIALAQRAKAFGFNVIFYDPSTAEGLDRAIGGLDRVHLIADLLTKSDCISLHCSLTEDSRHIIGDNALRLFKRGAFLINVTHSQLVDEEALVKALRGGKLAGAGLDVVDDYRDIPKEVPNLIVTPRVAWYSRESYSELRRSAIRVVHHVLTTVDGANLDNCVNSDQLNPENLQLRWSSDATS